MFKHCWGQINTRAGRVQPAHCLCDETSDHYLTAGHRASEDTFLSPVLQIGGDNKCTYFTGVSWGLSKIISEMCLVQFLTQRAPYLRAIVINSLVNKTLCSVIYIEKTTLCCPNIKLYYYIEYALPGNEIPNIVPLEWECLLSLRNHYSCGNEGWIQRRAERRPTAKLRTPLLMLWWTRTWKHKGKKSLLKNKKLGLRAVSQ